MPQNLFRISGILTEIRFKHTPTACLEHYHDTNPLAYTSFVHRSINITLKLGASEVYLCTEQLENVS
jgi:hypothetical protein